MECCFLPLTAASAQLVWCCPSPGSSDGQSVCLKFSPVAPGVEGEHGPGGQYPCDVFGGVAQVQPSFGSAVHWSTEESGCPSFAGHEL